MLLSSVLVAHTSGSMHHPQTVDYLFRSVQKLMADREQAPAAKTFDFTDVSVLVDAFFKSKAGLGKPYGDMLLEHLDE